ncbi:protein naked cuticle homolog 1 isoform X2 [Sturnira hondurensis]|uniref:protein naked cuticle homolog 1 isoform X1 n=1 Tax=Sturnira hondurensis TaxID=192404 RepID=UPI00187ADF21|nr:protein naked cuticle homolog 1 isoform X1 [Sturnira hondurensis]XP_036922245.1 protein naked cuticle homolog 1 isoform X2 [Sturnira hondurensis]
MGKLHSKPAAVCKRRESPEGDSFAVSAAWARKGIEEWIGRQRCPGGSSGPRQLRAAGTVGRGARELVGEVFRETLSEEEEEDFRLEVALPPEKTDGLASGDEKRMEKPSESCPGSRKQLKFEELQCDVSVEEDSRQEWTFTLYDFDNNGKVTREDITSLLHTIYEVVDSSVNHSPTSSKTLRVKLTVAPDGSQGKKSILLNHPDLQTTRPRAETKPAEELRSWEKKQRALLRFQGDSRLEQSGCQHHCVDENIERRNHYLDLAGIENYTSQFGPGSPSVAQKSELPPRTSNPTRSRSHEPEAVHAPHRKPPGVDPGSSHGPDTPFAKVSEAQQRLRGTQDGSKHFVRSPKAQGKSVGVGHGARGARSKPPLGPTVPAASPSSHLAASAALLPTLAPLGHKKHRHRAKESQQGGRGLQGPPAMGSALAGRDQVRELPTVVVYDGPAGQAVQRHEHRHHHEHHHHHHHFYQT